MKTKDLITLLKKFDPSGDLECCVDNHDILSVETLPAYYDGSLEVLIRDPKNKYYNIVGAKIVRTGDKVKIRTHSIEDAIYQNPDLSVEYTLRDENWIQRVRQEARELNSNSND